MIGLDLSASEKLAVVWIILKCFYVVTQSKIQAKLF